MTKFLCWAAFAVIFICINGEETTSEHKDHEDHLDFDFSAFFADDNTEDEGHLEYHMKEDIGIEKSVENMTESEKDWYYFKMHDLNEDMRLDGLELLKAWQHHYLEHMGHDGLDHTIGEDSEEHRKFIEDQNNMFVIMVDNILKETDMNNDGYLDYLEYMLVKVKNRSETNTASQEQTTPK